MVEAVYDGSLEGLFAILAGVCEGAPLPDRIRPFPPPGVSRRGERETPELAFFDPPPAPTGTAAPLLGAEEFFSLSAGAFDSVLCAWMSEFPIEREIIRFARKVIFAARDVGARVPGALKSEEARRAAERARTDWGDGDVEIVLNAASKVRREADRLLGFLRFKAGPEGLYTARCAPDHFVLPCLGRHFSGRFGKKSWRIIDEKRFLCLGARDGGEVRLLPLEALSAETTLSGTEEPAGKADRALPGKDPGKDPWEELWRTYHGAINNPSRKNPGLQRQFMPLRYWKYLTEMRGR